MLFCSSFSLPFSPFCPEKCTHKSVRFSLTKRLGEKKCRQLVSLFVFPLVRPDDECPLQRQRQLLSSRRTIFSTSKARRIMTLSMREILCIFFTTNTLQESLKLTSFHHHHWLRKLLFLFQTTTSTDQTKRQTRKKESRRRRKKQQKQNTFSSASELNAHLPAVFTFFNEHSHLADDEGANDEERKRR